MPEAWIEIVEEALSEMLASARVSISVWEVRFNLPAVMLIVPRQTSSILSGEMTIFDVPTCRVIGLLPVFKTLSNCATRLSRLWVLETVFSCIFGCMRFPFRLGIGPDSEEECDAVYLEFVE